MSWRPREPSAEGGLGRGAGRGALRVRSGSTARLEKGAALAGGTDVDRNNGWVYGDVGWSVMGRQAS